MEEQKRQPSIHNAYVRIVSLLLKKLYVLTFIDGLLDWGQQQITLNHCPNLAKIIFEEQIGTQKDLKILFIDDILCKDFKTKKSNTKLNKFIQELRNYKIFNLEFFKDGNKQLKRERQFNRNFVKLLRPVLGLLLRVTIYGDKTIKEIGSKGTNLLRQIVNNPADQKTILKNSIGTFTKFNFRQFLKPIFKSVDRKKYDYVDKMYKQQDGNKSNDNIDVLYGQVNFPSGWFQVQKAKKFYKKGPTLQSKFQTNKGSRTVCEHIKQNSYCKRYSAQQNDQLLSHILQLLDKIEANKMQDDKTTRKDGNEVQKRFSPSKLKKVINPRNQMQQEEESSNSNLGSSNSNLGSVSDSRRRQMDSDLIKNVMDQQDSFSYFDMQSSVFSQQYSFLFLGQNE